MSGAISVSPDPPSRLATSPSPRLEWRLLAALVPFVILVIGYWPTNPVIGDAAQYLLHAHAIVDGRPYTDIGYIYSPRVTVGPAAYPPGLPVTIAAVLALHGGLTAVSVLLVCIGALYLYLAGKYFSMLDDANLAPAMMLASGVVPGLVVTAARPLSDLPFCALVWAVCLLVDGAETWSTKRILAITALGAAAIMFRIAGVALIPALVVHEALRFRAVRLRGALPVTLWTAVFIAIAVALPVNNSHAYQMSLWSGLGLREVVEHVVRYSMPLAELQFYPLPWAAGNRAYHIAFFCLMVIGLWLWGRGARRRFLLFFAAFYFGVLLLVPWQAARYLWPLLPLIWFGLLRAITAVAELPRSRRLRPNGVRVAWAAVVAIPVLSSVWAKPYPGEFDYLAMSQSRQLFAFLDHASLRANIRVAFFEARVLSFGAGVPAMGLFSAPPDTILSELRARKITHVVDGTMGFAPTESQSVRKLLAKYPSLFSREFANDSFTVYRITSP